MKKLWEQFKTFATIMWGIYTVLFLFEYVAVKAYPEEKAREYCERLFTMPVWMLATVANGDGNACLDRKFYPKTTAREAGKDE